MSWTTILALVGDHAALAVTALRPKRAIALLIRLCRGVVTALEHARDASQGIWRRHSWLRRVARLAFETALRAAASAPITLFTWWITHR